MRLATSSSPARQRGIALLLVLFAVGFLSIIVVGLIRVSQFSWNDSELERFRFQARLLAESGAALATHPDVEPGDPVLRNDFGDGRMFEVRITSEGGRMLVSSLDDDVLVNTTRELFIRWGLDANRAAIASESLADWIDDEPCASMLAGTPESGMNSIIEKYSWRQT